MGWHRRGDESEYMRTSVSAVRITTRIRAAIYCERHPILMGWHRHGDESEYMRTSVSAVRITTRIRAAIYCERPFILMEWRHPVTNPSM